MFVRRRAVWPVAWVVMISIIYMIFKKSHNPVFRLEQYVFAFSDEPLCRSHVSSRNYSHLPSRNPYFRLFKMVVSINLVLMRRAYWYLQNKRYYASKASVQQHMNVRKRPGTLLRLYKGYHSHDSYMNVWTLTASVKVIESFQYIHNMEYFSLAKEMQRSYQNILFSQWSNLFATPILFALFDIYEMIHNMGNSDYWKTVTHIDYYRQLVYTHDVLYNDCCHVSQLKHIYCRYITIILSSAVAAEYAARLWTFCKHCMLVWKNDTQYLCDKFCLGTLISASPVGFW